MNVTRGSVFSFNLDKVHPHDLATFLDLEGISVRAGHHCAHPLLSTLGVPALTRASVSVFNTRDEVNFLVTNLERAKTYFGRF
jgi:cysteine desulfurase/selenocysteine lyase